MVGNCANIYGPYMYPATDGPRYLPGGSSTASVALLVSLLAILVRLVLQKENKALAARESVDSDGNMVSATANERNDRAVGFRYVL